MKCSSSYKDFLTVTTVIQNIFAVSYYFGMILRTHRSAHTIYEKQFYKTSSATTSSRLVAVSFCILKTNICILKTDINTMLNY
jgi:hypothetical protein